MNTLAMVRAGTRAMIGAKSVNSIIRQRRRLDDYSRQVKKQKTSSSRSSLGITNQFDVKRMYRARRRKPRRVIKRWRKFQRRVQRAISSEIPTQIELFRGHLDITATAGTQQMFGCVLYGEAGSNAAANDLGAQDLKQVVNDSNNLITTNTNKLQFKSAYLDLYLTNTGQTPAATTIYVDIYTVYCRKDVYQYNGVSDFCANTYADSTTLAGGTALASTVFGVTPFQNPMFCSHFKIGEVKRVVLENGQTYNIQMKDHKIRNYYFGKTEKVVCLKGWTKGFLCVFKGAAGYNAQDVASNLAIECLRTYTFDYFQTTAQSAGYRNV